MMMMVMMIRPALSCIATCNIIWNPLISPNWTQASKHTSSKTKERVWWDEVDVTRKRLREEKIQETEEGATKQNDSAAAPSDQPCPPSFNIKSSRTKQSPVVCPRHGIAGWYLENCICISRTTGCICITSSTGPILHLISWLGAVSFACKQDTICRARKIRC